MGSGLAFYSGKKVLWNVRSDPACIEMSENKYHIKFNASELNDARVGLAKRIKPRQRVLELGCSSGYFSEYLSCELGCRVVGVEIDGDAAQQAAKFCERVIVADLDNDDWLSELQGELFDVLVCADVLEHLKNPVELLANIKPFLHADSIVLASVPNVAHASVRLELLQGHFDYESLGLLDETHLHFYTRNGLIALFMQAGYACCDIVYNIRDLADETIEQALVNVGLKATETVRNVLHAPDAVAYQFIIEARPAKVDLLKNFPEPLSPKPLVSSGVFYADLKQQLDAELEHNKNHRANIQRLEEKIVVIEQQRDAEQVHNKNQQQHIRQLEEKIDLIEQQRDAEQVHNKDYQKAIEKWRATVAALDSRLFELMDQLQQEQEKNHALHQQVLQLQETAAHYQEDVQRLEQVLKRVHSKVSYRMVRLVKDGPEKVKGFLQKAKVLEDEVGVKEDQGNAVNVHDYRAWLAAYGELTEKELELIKSEIAVWQSPPKIAVLMPVYNPGKVCLQEAIESVLQQLYGHFELCIADDASTERYVAEVLEHYARKDQRIKVVFRKRNGHISAASNSALELVAADYVALMDHDDLLAADALYRVAKAIRQYPDAQLFYSDEDKMDLQGNRYAPYFKPDWNPELFLSHNFICHLGVYKTAGVKALGGFDSAFDGAQDYDLALRYVAALDNEQIIHIPRILYHWRAVEGSTANGIHEKPYAQALIEKAVSCALQQKQRAAEVFDHERLPGALRVRYLLPEALPLVSIVIPTRNGFGLLRRCVESIFAKTQYTNYELLIIDNGSDDLVTLRYLQRLRDDERVTVIRDDSPFNYAALNNKAVAQARGEIIALLNDDLEVINGDWLDEMVSHAVHSEVGAVGAKLYYPDNTVQHAGVIVGLGGVAGHSHKHFLRDNPGFCGRLLLTQNLSAVTAACMLLRKEVFDAVGGFDEQNLSVAFNDVDLCLRIKEYGLNIVWTPYAELYHYESASRGYEDTPEKQARFNKEVAYMKQRWRKTLLSDPAYNPNLTVEREDFSFSWPPRSW